MARGPMSRRVESLRYRHSDDGQWYEHQFEPGVELRPKDSGAVELRRPDGKPVWDRFRGRPSRFLVNPPGGDGPYTAALYETRVFGEGQQGGASGFDTLEEATRWARGELKRAGRGQAVVTAYGGVKASLGYQKGRLLTRMARANYGVGRRYRFHGAFGALERADAKAAAVGGWVQPAKYGKGERWLVLTDKRQRSNPTEGQVAKKRRKRPSAKQRAARRRFAAMARARAKANTPRRARRRRARRARSNPRRARSVTVSRGGNMARKRRRGRRRGAARRRRAVVVRVNRPRGRRRYGGRRRYRSNPRRLFGGGVLGRRGIVGSLVSGMVGGLATTGGTVATVTGARFLAFIPDTLAGNWTLVLKQALVASILTPLADMVLPPQWAAAFSYGCWAAPAQAAIRQSGIPVLATGLGECDSWGVLGYAPSSPVNRALNPAGVSAYAPRSQPYTGVGDDGLQGYAPQSFGNTIGF